MWSLNQINSKVQRIQNDGSLRVCVYTYIFIYVYVHIKYGYYMYIHIHKYIHIECTYTHAVFVCIYIYICIHACFITKHHIIRLIMKLSNLRDATLRLNLKIRVRTKRTGPEESVVSHYAPIPRKVGPRCFVSVAAKAPILVRCKCQELLASKPESFEYFWIHI